MFSLSGGSSGFVKKVLLKTYFERSKTLHVRQFGASKIALTKARLLKHELPVHNVVFAQDPVENAPE